ncbi:hypothetical protein [Cohnella abietis]|uniref:Uncharacterized protein n=1 Tax=Cohnella abietis TaxID=2507935 RepID=A0A3T1D1Q5_9BACL|nr:hypothetical protein [Cohnella abietis]BBI32024.1 hypothetical protein KCTCHS21_14230 [Cohnella abietis]
MIKLALTRDDARKHFADSGLTYASIDKAKIEALKIIIQKHLDVRNKYQADTEMKINKRNKKTVFSEDGSLLGCQLTMRCHYFNSREAITFGTSGFIGFCGWADDVNAAPLISAFIEWVDKLAGLEG